MDLVMTKWKLNSLACLILACNALPAHAQDAPNPPEVPARVQLEYRGTAGMWFRMDHARLILTDVLTLETKKQEVGLLEKRRDLADYESERIRLALEQSEKAEARATHALEIAVRHAREAEEKQDSIFSGKPWLWGGVGIVLGLVTTATVALK